MTSYLHSGTWLWMHYTHIMNPMSCPKFILCSFPPFLPLSDFDFLFHCLLGFYTSTFLTVTFLISSCVTLCCRVQLVPGLYSPSAWPWLWCTEKILVEVWESRRTKISKIWKLKTDGSATVGAETATSSRTLKHWEELQDLPLLPAQRNWKTITQQQQQKQQQGRSTRLEKAGPSPKNSLSGPRRLSCVQRGCKHLT